MGAFSRANSRRPFIFLNFYFIANWIIDKKIYWPAISLNFGYVIVFILNPKYFLKNALQNMKEKKQLISEEAMNAYFLDTSGWQELVTFFKINRKYKKSNWN